MIKALILSALLALYAPSAMACRFTESLTDEDMAQAQSVFVGAVRDYMPADDADRAQITLTVLENVSGREMDGTITINWANGSLGTPTSFQQFRDLFGLEMKVGILFPETFPEECEFVESNAGADQELRKTERCASVFAGSGTSEHPWIVQRHCSSPFIMPHIEATDEL